MISQHQEGPDFDNPSFYPKPQQPSAGVNFHLIFVRLSFDRNFLQAPPEVKVGASIGRDSSESERVQLKLACMEMPVSWNWLPIKQASFQSRSVILNNSELKNSCDHKSSEELVNSLFQSVQQEMRGQQT